jgi:ribulose-phosphate 3-epimerase
MSHIAPTLLCADLLDLGRQIDGLERHDIRWHHVDVMDGHFVPNLAFGTDVVKAIGARASKPVLAHLMVERPQDYIQALAQSVDYFVFHLEATRTPFRIIGEARDAGLKPGVAINPSTSPESLAGLLPLVDVVTLMAVEPGFSGQVFMEQTYCRIAKIRALARDLAPEVLIEVDGGIDEPIGAACLKAGADVLVGGVFSLFRKGRTLDENYVGFAAVIEG